jgi:diguanylate cyclase (GGDEF)-like protein
MLLEQVGKRLQACVRATDTVARLGGDEFIVLLPDAGQHLAAASEHARSAGLKILHSLQRPFELARHTHHANCSIGAVVLANPAEQAETYLKQADTAMYQAKALGGGRLQVYSGD